MPTVLMLNNFLNYWNLNKIMENMMQITKEIGVNLILVIDT